MVVPTNLDLTIFGLDPAVSILDGTDDTGIIVGGRDRSGEIYVWRDKTGKHTPEQYASIVVDECIAGAAGGVVETNRGGMTITAAIRAAAREKGMEVRVLSKSQWSAFPRRTPGVIYIREIHSRGSKYDRGGAPAALYKQGKVHHIGELPDLEYEQTTYEPGTAESPNRYDACNQVVNELAELDSNKPTAQHQRKRAAVESQASTALRGRLTSINRGRGIV